MCNNSENQNSPSPQISVWLGIWGHNLNPDECSKYIGIKATETRRQPDYFVKNNNPRIGWYIGFRRREFDDTSDAINELMDTIWERRDKIKSLVKEHGFDLSIACNITIWEDRPLYSLRPEIIKKLAYFECEVLFDIFDYSEDHEVDSVSEDDT